MDIHFPEDSPIDNNHHQLSMTNNVTGTYSLHGLIFGSYNSSSRSIGENGTIGGATMIDGNHAPGNGGVGEQRFGDNLTFSTTSTRC